MKAWLKGGLIAIAIYIFFTIILLPFGIDADNWFALWTIPSIPGVLIMTPFVKLFLTPGSGGVPNTIAIPMMIVLSLIFYFLVGALIGKIKSPTINSNQ